MNLLKALFTQGMVCHNTYKNESMAWVFPDDVEKKERKLFSNIHW